MMTRMKFLAITVLTAGLFTGSAALAQGIEQTDDVSYALTLIDAGDGTGNSATGGPVTSATTKVRVKVTVSVPREEGSSAYGSVSNKANPVRLMYRKHRGPATAFNGSISLTRDAPYAWDATTDAYGASNRSAYYPMPQVKDGKVVRDPTQVNYTAVSNGATANAAGTNYTTYLYEGQSHDPARWEATYLSPAYDLDWSDLDTFSEKYPMIYSLLIGQGSYEWYAASRYGMSSFTRISPIQDIARAMSFTDVRLWQPLETTQSAADVAYAGSSTLTLGDAFEWRTWAMPEANPSHLGWHIYRGSIGVNDMGSGVGLHLLNILGTDTTDYSDYPRVESPVYPDGIGSITFEAMVSNSVDPTPQELLVQYRTGGIHADWQNLLEDDLAIVVTTDKKVYTIDFEGKANSNAQFRLIRKTTFSTGGSADTLTMIIRDLFVRSAKPQATFSKPTFSPTYPAYNLYDADGKLTNEAFEVNYLASSGDGTGTTTADVMPRGYSATLNVARRVTGDTTRSWKKAKTATTVFSESSGDATLTTTFTRGRLLTTNGTVNVDEGAFFMNAGKVTGLLPGVYDLALHYQIFGSFLAGREIIDAHETVDGVVSTYDVAVTDETGQPVTDATGQPVVEQHPIVLDFREHETAHEGVYLRVMYRSGTKDSSAPYTLESTYIPLLPSSHEPNVWRVDLAKALKLEDETAVYAWGYDAPAGADNEDPDPIFVENKIAFTVCAFTDKGEVWYGQRAATAVGAMPPVAAVVPAFTETLSAGDKDEVVPVVLEIEDLTSSHVMVELELPGAASATELSMSVAGSYWQDFNTWHVTSDDFAKTDFRENLASCTADFDCTVENIDGEHRVTSGWIPDEGPLANTTSFIESFEIGRAIGDNTDTAFDSYTFFMHDLATQGITNRFASWGAGSDLALPQYVRKDKSATNFNAKYFKFGKGAEIVLKRNPIRQSTTYLPDAQIRLRGTGNSITPITESAGGVALNGVGTVSFTLGLSLPHNFDQRARLLSSSTASAADIFALNSYGIAAVVQIPSDTTTSPTGYSVSYYLDNMTYGGVAYELRLTQICDFGTTDSAVPSEVIVAELYRWTADGATRLSLSTTAGALIPDGYQRLGGKLGNGTTAYGLWVDQQGYLVVGTSTNLSLTSLTSSFKSSSPVVDSSFALGFTPAFGSAECRPTFRQLFRAKNRAGTFSSDTGGVGITDSQILLNEPSSPSWGTSWTAGDDPNYTCAQISRQTPKGRLAGAVSIRAERQDGTSTGSIVSYTEETAQKMTVVLGEANSTLIIEPEGEDSNIFLDDISVTSWCGNDENRNNVTYGASFVPAFTDFGFLGEKNGFAGVGLWICPEDKNQSSVAASNYRGEQCLLMQRSRQNTATNLTGEIEENGIRHTGSSLALYSPYSNAGFGPVSFRYCIPEKDEFGNTGVLPPVYVMLQYLESATYSNDYLTKKDDIGWKTVSDPIMLENTKGVWRMASIVPKLDGQELVGPTEGKRGATGTLRLVMVLDSDDPEYDPYVYIDDFMVTDNATGSLASWSAENVKLTDSPVSHLYWKDRVPTPATDPAEETFAEKSTLTRAMQLNDEVTTDCNTCVLNTPLLPEGVGRIRFAARLADEQAEPVRLYILATENKEEVNLIKDFTPVTYVEVTNTVYTVYDVDLSKYSTYYTRPTETLMPGESFVSDEFSSAKTRRLQLRSYLKTDGVTHDGFGTPAENRAPNYGRVLLDTLVVTSPVLPSLRVESVAFSNVNGSDVPTEFDRQSPLSQPITGAPALRVMVELGQMQLLRNDSIRVFVTLNTSSDIISSYTGSYRDVMGNTVTATTDRPIYFWDSGARDKWPLDQWFDLDAFVASTDWGTAGELTTADLAAKGFANMVELTKRDGNYFFGDLSDLEVGTNLKVTQLPANSLVRYNAIAVYKSEESDQWFATQITPSTHTDFPWYFPRNLNLEMQEGALDDETDNEGADFFSPYYWVYSCLPGEVFINEFDLRNNSSLSNGTDAFVEVCAPTKTNLKGWGIDFTTSGTALSQGLRWSIGQLGEPTTVAATHSPAAGVVPAMRVEGTSAERSFYTVFSDSSDVFYMGTVDGEETRIETFNDVADKPNAGVATRGFVMNEALGSNTAATIQLVRPTGGAEHIVIYPTHLQKNLTLPVNKASLEAVDNLYNLYQAAYISKGFGSEWYQTFLDGSWKDYKADFGDILLLEDIAQEKAHGRRLTKANFFPSNGESENYRFDQTATSHQPVQDSATATWANSIATIDMGGMWVTRLNTTGDNLEGGVLDLSDLYAETWPGFNPVKQARSSVTGAEHTQVTPRQINLDQFLVKYTGLAQSLVMSQIEGNLLASHELGLYNADGSAISETRRAGRNTPQTWSLNLSVPKVQLVYKPLPFQKINTVQVRLVDAKTGAIETSLAAIKAQLAGYTIPGDPNPTATDGWVTVEPKVETVENETRVYVDVTLTKDASAENRYNLEAKATVGLDPDSTIDEVITKVSPYCGGTIGTYQPWWGSSFGFEVIYDESKAEGAVLSGAIVTYPSPTGLTLPNQWQGLKSPWAGVTLTYKPDPAQPEETVSLVGMEYDAALELLKTVIAPVGKARFVEIKGASGGRMANASLTGILSTSYATAMGYREGDSTTWEQKEPAIPFCVWGVYTYTIQTDEGTEKVSFLMPQASPADQPVFEYPAWYQPLEDWNVTNGAEAAVPYFYLYSTPPQSAWLNEVNLDKGDDTGSDPYAEIVMPKLRQGILDANPNVPQTTNFGWEIARYGDSGNEVSTLPLTTDSKPSYSSSYTYTVMDIASLVSEDLSAYVLKRPCGAAEGGVWLRVSDSDDADVLNGTELVSTALPADHWLGKAESCIAKGRSDSSAIAGSVQLVGDRIYDAINNAEYITSEAARRTVWKFTDESKGEQNDDKYSPDLKPEWNQVTITSEIRNAVYGGVLCGYQVLPGFIEKEEVVGVASTTGPISHTLSGIDWKYTVAMPKVVSYRPRAGYRFESMALPPEMIGHVMLIGSEGTLMEADVANRVTALLELAAQKTDAPYTDWIQMGGQDITNTNTYRAKVEYISSTDETGAVVDVPSGIIRFNPDYVAYESEGESVTFGDQSNFVITLVFVDEPVSAQNTIQVSMDQGNVQLGAWLVSQTLWAQDETGAPDEDKGGDTVAKPIWSDANGNIDGKYINQLGWAHQPLVGDKLGMSAVINPELGLVGGKLGYTVEDVRDRLESENAALRPFLVWTVIPEEKVPVSVFVGDGEVTQEALTFFNNWSLNNSYWIGGSPSVMDQTTLSLTRLRSTLEAQKNSDSGFYRDAGIIPMIWRGHCDEDRNLVKDSDKRARDTLLAFSTMTDAELEAAMGTYSAETGLSNSDTTLLAYDTKIDMDKTKTVNGKPVWTDGAVLRFAIVIADPTSGTIYDCQSIANFSSEDVPYYCPWYLPDPVANINRTTSEFRSGISPFAWVYEVARGGVWLNEIRPFAHYNDTSAEVAAIPSVVELAMFASPLTNEKNANGLYEPNTAGEYLPEFSLDGWKLVMKTAPMPSADPKDMTALDWDVQQTVDLMGWIPSIRLDPDYDPSASGANANYYELDYYCLTTSVDAGWSVEDNDRSYYGYPGNNPSYPVTMNNFEWLRLEDELFEKGLEAELRATDKYAAGVVYAISLVRNNGVVVDEVLFYNSKHNLYDGDGLVETRVKRAIELENMAYSVANTVRGVSAVTIPFNEPGSTAQFVDVNDTLTWVIESDYYNTLPGSNSNPSINGLEYKQPKQTVVLNPITSTFSLLSARIIGGDASLSLSQSSATLLSGQTLTAQYLTGTPYTLSLSSWRTDWFDLQSVTKNGQDITAEMTTGTTYMLNAAGLLASSETLVVDETTLTGDTDYALSFVYTPTAAKLVEAGDLASNDDGFLEWLLNADPEAILNQTEEDGVTAAEKYWLGLDSAVIDATDVKLAITEIGSHVEPTETLPTIAVSLKNGDEPISEISGDGVLILLGKESLDGDWQYVRRLYPEDLNGDSTLILRTPCTFFKALLLSEAQVTDYKE